MDFISQSGLKIYSTLSNNIPGANVLFLYIKNSYQNDPFRIVLELFLIIFAFKYLLSKKYAPDRDAKAVKLTEKEVEELIHEWKPEPLVQPTSEVLRRELESIPVIHGPVGPHVTLLDGKDYLNLSSFDFLGLSRNEGVHTATVEALRKYGVGACGPPGFYGTLDVHLQLENDLAKFLGTEEAIIYSQAYSAISSVIPAFSKRGDILVCDEAISFPIQKGVQISRSTVLFYKHNDMEDLERVLKQVTSDNEKSKKKLTRRFIVFEALSYNYGDIAPLPKILELKLKYKFRVIVDETLSFGVLGKRGAGISDFYNVPATDLDIISSSMTHSLGSGGGFCAGSKQVVDHQRLSGLAYCFSAAMPALLAVAAIEGLNDLKAKPSILANLRENIKAFRSALGTPKHMTLNADSSSPVIHLRLQQTFEDRQKEEDLLQAIVKQASLKSLLLTRAKYVIAQEINAPKSSIRLTVSAGHTPSELELAAKSIRKAVEEALATATK